MGSGVELVWRGLAVADAPAGTALGGTEEVRGGSTEAEVAGEP